MTLFAAERQSAKTSEVLVRDFEQRITREVDNAVARLAATADELIKTDLAARIETKIGDNLVAVLGEKLARETSETNKMSTLRRDSSDSFIQMRSRALEYARSAERQSTFFRIAGVYLAILGLMVLGGVLVISYNQYIKNPDISKDHLEWSSVIMHNAPIYSFSVLCEFLALIMFRYQSKSLEYMRYFSNEATNIDARNIAFNAALILLDKTKISKIMEKLESTERNFLLNKDQKTLEMANNENEDRLLDRVKALLDRREPK